MPLNNIYVDPSAIVIGQVVLCDGVSVWPCAVIRGDVNSIEIGEDSNVQDTAVLHASHDNPTKIGKRVTVGHGAVINGAVVGDDCLIGINSTILDGAVIGNECIIGANAIVTARTVIPSRSLVLGVPGRIVRTDDETILETARRSARDYADLRDKHLKGMYKRHIF
ncbi:MAG: gamma carbonic anhydrase family protein [Methanomassiliicoccales archaeon]|nr:MAG: gamma carbonic anhydrase family protein [Methanomassiliicoccales archaeon]